MNALVPIGVFFTKGVGVHRDELQSFELALRGAGIERCNLVYVSSILPPRCSIISRDKGLRRLISGEVIFCVMSRCSSNEPKRLISAAVGCVIPADGGQYGYISEHHGYGQTEKVAGDYVEDLAASMLASTLGIEIDLDGSWDAKKEIFKMDGGIVRTRNCTQSGVVGMGGWMTVIAAAVFVF